MPFLVRNYTNNDKLEPNRKYIFNDLFTVMPVTHFLVQFTRCIARLIGCKPRLCSCVIVCFSKLSVLMGSNKAARHRNVKNSRIAPDLVVGKTEKKRKAGQPIFSKTMVIVFALVVVFLTGAYYR